MIISKAQKTFNGANVIFMALLGLTMVMPIIHVIAQSLSDNAAINTGRVAFWPVEFTLDNYLLILKDMSIWIAFRNSVIITVFGTLINLTATASLAYPLSRPEYLGRTKVLILVLVTLIFSAPLIPNYLLIKQLGLLDTLWALIAPSAISAFNLFVMRSFFMNLPNELIDSGKMDGQVAISALSGTSCRRCPSPLWRQWGSSMPFLTGIRIQRPFIISIIVRSFLCRFGFARLCLPICWAARSYR